MRILVCSPGWPTSKTIDFVFVEQLCRAFADLGHKVIVIAPQSLTKCLVRHVPLAKKHQIFSTTKGNVLEIYRPYTISLGNSGLKLKFGTYEQAVKRAFKSFKDKPDVCYGHFWESIFAIYHEASKQGIPLFGASGEENVGYYVHKTEEFKKKVRDYLSGVISVSSKNQEECFKLNLISREKSIVIPNAIDQSLFHVINKAECRKQFGIMDDDFVVIFVGQFIPRKGTLRLNDALKLIDDEKVKAVFIGSGSEDPDYERIIHKGLVPHEDVPKWLNAADVFVLPTENEGCCNAIIEAMACGLPIISTNAPFNYDLLNNRNSIFIDCHDINEIATAILRIKKDVVYWQKLSDGALKTAEDLSITKRATVIIDFIYNKLKV